MKISGCSFRLSILAGALLAASPIFAATEQLTISTDTTYAAPIENQAVVINESGTLRGTAGETEMLIQGGMNCPHFARQIFNRSGVQAC